MEPQIFNLEEERLQEEVRKRAAKRVLLQLPEGLKAVGPHLASLVEEVGAVAIVSADPCYGACDLAIQDAESLGADLLVHYGHSEMTPLQQVPTIYIEAKTTISVKPAVTLAIPLLKPWSSVGLATTVQHINQLDEARVILLESGKSVAVGDAGRLEHAGQVTGCDYSNARSISEDVDAFVFVGGGRFHALGVALATEKPTIVADPYENRAYAIHGEIKQILKKRWAAICEAREAGRFGILIGLKSGQKRMPRALRVQKDLEKGGKRATLLALREIVPERLMQFPSVEAFVNTACPRISLDGTSRFRRPILTPSETLVALGEMDWEDLCRRGWFEDAT